MYKAIFLLSLMITFSLSCGPKARYKVPDKDAYLYNGIHWHKAYTQIHQQRQYTTDPVTGKLVKRSLKQKRIALLNKAHKILLKTPEGAPHSMVWLVYVRLKLDLQKEVKNPNIVYSEISPRRRIQ